MLVGGVAGWMRQWAAVVGVSAAGFDILLAVSRGAALRAARGAAIARHDSARGASFANLFCVRSMEAQDAGYGARQE